VSSKENVLGFRTAAADREIEALLRQTSVYLKSTLRPQLLKAVRTSRVPLVSLAKRLVR
jgi:hypothetical protein